MTRAIITIRNDHDRARAAHWAKQAPEMTRIEFKATKRTGAQNDLMWALLTEVATQIKHADRKYSADQWKILFLHAIGREVQFIPALDNSTFIPWGQSSSDLSKEEMTNLIEFILSWGAEHGVKFSDPDSNSSDAQQAISDRTSTPAAESGPHPDAAGVPPLEVSTLSDDWRDVVIQNLAGHRDQPCSLKHRYADAMQMVGGTPNAQEAAWIDLVWRLIARHNKGQLKRGEYDAEIERMKAGPLPAEGAWLTVAD